MNKVWKNSALNLAYKLTSMLFPLISSAYVARILLPSGVGRVAAAQNIVAYFAVFAALGLPSYGIREIAKVREDHEKLNRTFSELVVINAVSTTIAIAGYLILVLSVERFRQDLPLYLVCGLQLVFNYLSIDWLYQGEEDYVYICVRSILIKIVALLVLFLRVRTPDDYIWHAGITSCALGLNYIFNMIHSNKYVRFTLKGLCLKKHFGPLMVLLATILLSSIYSRVDITMLDIMSTEEATGFYTNAHKIVEIITMLCVSVTNVMLPRLSYSYEHDRETFYKLLAQGIRLLAFITIPLMIGVLQLASHGMQIMYGDRFAAGATTLRILSALIVVKCFGDLLCYQLTICTKNEKKRLPAYFCAAFVNIILNAMLIPQMANNGAAIASVISELLVNGIQIVIMKRMLGFKLEWKAIAQSMISTTFMAAVIAVVLLLVNNMVMQLMMSVLLGSTAYIVSNIVLKNDIAVSLLRAIHLKR